MRLPQRKQVGTFMQRGKRIILRLRQGLRSKLIANGFMQRAPGSRPYNLNPDITSI